MNISPENVALDTFINVVGIASGAVFFSTGLSGRTDTVPDLFVGSLNSDGATKSPLNDCGCGDNVPNGTFPGILLASGLVLGTNSLACCINCDDDPLLRSGQNLLTSISFGGLAFALGATNFSLCSRDQCCC